jgi:hypothetical protein
MTSWTFTRLQQILESYLACALCCRLSLKDVASLSQCMSDNLNCHLQYNPLLSSGLAGEITEPTALHYHALGVQWYLNRNRATPYRPKYQHPAIALLRRRYIHFPYGPLHVTGGCSSEARPRRQ